MSLSDKVTIYTEGQTSELFVVFNIFSYRVLTIIKIIIK